MTALPLRRGPGVAPRFFVHAGRRRYRVTLQRIAAARPTGDWSLDDIVANCGGERRHNCAADHEKIAVDVSFSGNIAGQLVKHINAAADATNPAQGLPR